MSHRRLDRRRVLRAGSRAAERARRKYGHLELSLLVHMMMNSVGNNSPAIRGGFIDRHCVMVWQRGSQVRLLFPVPVGMISPGLVVAGRGR